MKANNWDLHFRKPIPKELHKDDLPKLITYHTSDIATDEDLC